MVVLVLSESQLCKEYCQDTCNLKGNKCEGKGKVHPRTGHEGPEGE
jgi:hypothetical protein